MLCLPMVARVTGGRPAWPRLQRYEQRSMATTTRSTRTFPCGTPTSAVHACTKATLPARQAAAGCGKREGNATQDKHVLVRGESTTYVFCTYELFPRCEECSGRGARPHAFGSDTRRLPSSDQLSLLVNGHRHLFALHTIAFACRRPAAFPSKVTQ